MKNIKNCPRRLAVVEHSSGFPIDAQNRRPCQLNAPAAPRMGPRLLQQKTLNGHDLIFMHSYDFFSFHSASEFVSPKSVSQSQKCMHSYSLFSFRSALFHRSIAMPKMHGDSLVSFTFPLCFNVASLSF